MKRFALIALTVFTLILSACAQEAPMATLTCVSQENGSAICHIFTNERYVCEVDGESCHDGFQEFRGQDQSCLGALVCTPSRPLQP